MSQTAWVSSKMKSASATATQSKPLVDLGTRMAHASLALTFFISYITSESEYWRLTHVYSGYGVAVILAFRMVWGWGGPAGARWGFLLRRVAMWRIWAIKIKQGQWHTHNFWLGVSTWLLSAAVLCIYAFCAVSVTSGWATYNELLGDGWLNDALQELHEGLGTVAFYVVCVHVGLVVMLRWWRGPQALRPMWRSDANTSIRR